MRSSDALPQAARWITTWPGLLLLLCGLVLSTQARAQETWILVDTDALTLSVMQGDEAVRTFENIAIGRNGATRNRLYLDQKTPIGSFRISRIKEDSQYYLFFGVDYPDLQHARRSFETGIISEAEYSAIRQAHEQGNEPPANTPLGGYIGIHGIGDGDPSIHESFNWTDGCVALTNEEMDELRSWISINMVVLII